MMGFKQCECGQTAWQSAGQHVMLIDADDAHRTEVASRAWWPDAKPRPKRVKGTRHRGDPTNIALHRVLMGALKGQIVDHVNGNPLDNRRCNLRFASPGQNAMNCRSKRNGLKGVHLHRNGQWRAQIWANGSRYSLGLHDTEEEAHAAYVDAARQLHGDFFAAHAVSSPRKLNSDQAQQ